MKNNQTIKENFDFALENHKKNNLEVAEELYKKILEVYPNHFPSTVLLGTLSAQTKNFDLAKQLLKKAIKINPNHPEAHYNLGNCYRDFGDFQKGINCYKQATKYQPGNLAYFYSLSILKKEILNPNLRNNIEKIINDNNCIKKNMAFGNFLLSRYQSEEKNYEKEIDYLIKGHEYYFEFKKEKFTRQLKYWFDFLPNISKLIKLNKSNKKNDQIKPIFIVGVPRCGSTLLEKIIASGSKYIPIGEETSVLHELIKQITQEKQLSKFDEESVQITLLEKYKQKGLIQEKSDYIFTDKSLENFFYIALIKEIFPYAKVINCKRNVLCSIMSIMKNNLVDIPWAHNIENIFKYFDIYYQTIAYFEKTLPNFIYSLEYEKLVNEPEIESKKLMEYCELPWDKKCLEFYKRKDFISKTASNIQIRQAIYKHSLEKYLPYKKFLNKYAENYSWFK